METKIMIVDDAMFMRMVIKRALKTAGYENFTEVGDGREALERYKEIRPDLVLLDITMPERTGLEVLDDILTEDPGARVIMCSALGQEAVIAQAIQRGARDFIVKPFKDEMLVQMVKANLKA
ncbi:response regulator [[Clostridium] symbiosum]|uniref:response regulator n=1 Tax=Clostridium symbiosum TaxID=1512 RepID=UPI001D0802F0|nr:response regulator [[Clostridium] symbiosum]MCB6608049.1 response regulator [[Clostridium] symbiosum]MCB6931111.1 response regulator [[Clostridium] symbiosum]